jgi:phosphate transport system substrate-binding protein
VPWSRNKQKRTLGVGRLVGALAIGSCCLGCERSEVRPLILAGSTSVQPLAEKWAEAYEREHPERRIEVQGGGSTAGVQAVISGAAQIGMCSRALTSDEQKQLRPLLVARDGLALVVNVENPVSDLSLPQIRAIYAGDVRSWDSFGGTRAPITVITREEGSGTRSAFEELVMDHRRIAAYALVQDSTGTVRQMVASDAAAIGYISLGRVDRSVKALSIHGVVAAQSTIDSREYPLVRPFLFVMQRGNPNGTRDFVDWVTSERGRVWTRREGLLPPGLTP